MTRVALRPPGGLRLVVGLGLAELVAWGTLYYAFSVVVVAMEAELGWSPAWGTGAFALGLVVSGLVSVPLGRRIARHGSRTVMVTGALVGAAGLLAWSTVTRPVELLAAFAVVGAAMSATLYEPAFAVLAAVAGRGRHTGVVAVTALGGLGGAVFVPLTGLLTGDTGWRTTLRVLAAVVALLAAALLALPRSPTGTQGGDRTDAAPSLSPAVRRLALAVTLSSATKAALVVDMVALIASRGFSLGAASLAAGAAGLTQVAGRLGTVVAVHRVPEHRVAASVFATQALAALPLLLLPAGSGAETAAVAPGHREHEVGELDVAWGQLSGAEGGGRRVVPARGELHPRERVQPVTDDRGRPRARHLDASGRRAQARVDQEAGVELGER